MRNRVIKFYKLEGREVVSTSDFLEFAQWVREKGDIIQSINVDELEEIDTRVCTTFIGVDQSWGSVQPPLVFETMTFSKDPELDGWKKIYGTYDDAERGHREVVEAFKKLIENDEL